MTRIALVIGQLGLGGAEKQLCQLATGLPGWNYKPYVVSFGAGGEREKDLHRQGVKTFIFPRGGSFGVKRLLRLVAFLRNSQAEIVYGFDYAGSIYGRLAGIIAGVPILIGGLRSSWTPPRRVLSMERVLRWRTDAVISNSSAGKQVWMELVGYPAEKITVVRNGFNFAEMGQEPIGSPSLRALLGITNDEPVVGCIGSIYDLKNPLMFVEVAAAIADGETRVHFVWIGDGPMRQDVERAIAERGLSGRVHLLGSRADAQWLARDFRIGLMTSIVEGTPNAIMEYMYWGVPVVTTNVGDCKELVEHERTGFVVEKNDVQGMAGYIRQLLQAQVSAKRLGCRGRQKLDKEFSMETMLAKTVEVCERAKMRKRPGPMNVGRAV